MKKCSALFIITLILSIFLIHCAGQKPLAQTATGNIPVWYGNPNDDPNFVCGVSTQVSTDMDWATEKAIQVAQERVATQVEAEVGRLSKRFTEETGSGENSQLMQQWTTVSKSVSSVTLRECKIKNQEVIKDKNQFRAYVRMAIPVIQVKKSLLEQILSDPLLNAEYHATQAYKELEEEVKQIEE